MKPRVGVILRFVRQDIGAMPRSCPEIERVWTSNLRVYGADKVWKLLHREGIPVARCTVERLMRRHGWQGDMRGKRVGATVPAERPNQSGVSDFTYACTWQGFVYGWLS